MSHKLYWDAERLQEETFHPEISADRELPSSHCSLPSTINYLDVEGHSRTWGKCWCEWLIFSFHVCPHILIATIYDEHIWCPAPPVCGCCCAAWSSHPSDVSGKVLRLIAHDDYPTVSLFLSHTSLTKMRAPLFTSGRHLRTWRYMRCSERL